MQISSALQTYSHLLKNVMYRVETTQIWATLLQMFRMVDFIPSLESYEVQKLPEQHVTMRTCYELREILANERHLRDFPRGGGARLLRGLTSTRDCCLAGLVESVRAVATGSASRA